MIDNTFGIFKPCIEVDADADISRENERIWILSEGIVRKSRYWSGVDDTSWLSQRRFWKLPEGGEVGFCPWDSLSQAVGFDEPQSVEDFLYEESRVSWFNPGLTEDQRDEYFERYGEYL